MRPRSKRCLLLASALIVAACSGGQTQGGSTQASASLSGFCSAICDHINFCDRTRDVQTCTSQCENDNAAPFPKMRSDIVESIQTCFDAADCATVLQGTALSTCLDTATASVAPSDAGSSFCSAWASAETKCGNTLDEAKCLTMVKEYNDTAIDSAMACTSKSCSDILTCIEAEFDLSFGGGPSGALR